MEPERLRAARLVSGKLPVLEPGEVERAAAWAASLAAKAESQQPVAARTVQA